MSPAAREGRGRQDLRNQHSLAKDQNRFLYLLDSSRNRQGRRLELRNRDFFALNLFSLFSHAETIHVVNDHGQQLDRYVTPSVSSPTSSSWPLVSVRFPVNLW